EGYDAAAHWQTTDNGLPIDASGTIVGTDVDGAFNGGVDLSSRLARSATVHQCATAQWIRYALGRAATSVELPEVAALADAFMKSGGDVRALLLAVVTAPSFRL